ncbi:MAG: glycosyltransferase [Candidatus Omnitrophica bacterium]|nr:glycosyltransferase [Candidatus Omnitrophota bacterium]
MTGADYNFPSVEDYEPYIGPEAVRRIRTKAKQFKNHLVTHINSTYYGGGVAEMLSSVTLLMNDLGIKTGWRLIKGLPSFFVVTKKMHNALQGGDFEFNQREIDLYEAVLYENSLRMNLNHDFVVVHDPQPLGLIKHFRKKGPWIWRCHIDMSQPNQQLWDYLQPYVEEFDAAIFSMEQYKRRLRTPQVLFMPAIDPFTLKNKQLSEKEMDEKLKEYNIPTDLPLVTQVSRYDRWKDPEGVIEAYKIARKEVDCTLILLGNTATDDPEGQEVYESLLEAQDDRTLLMACGDDTALVNTLQARSAVVMQKSVREGFGLTVTEAMWKGTPVIGGNVGGIPAQISDGFNGFLVNSPQEAAERLVTLLKDENLRCRMGEKARESVKEKFLMTRLVEQYIDLFASFETQYRCTLPF